jgi:hypothetical protein
MKNEHNNFITRSTIHEHEMKLNMNSIMARLTVPKL